VASRVEGERASWSLSWWSSSSFFD